MLVLSNVCLPLDAGLPGHEGLVREVISTYLSVSSHDIVNFKITRRSVDARRRSDVHFTANIQVDLHQHIDEQEVAARVAQASVVAGALDNHSFSHTWPLSYSSEMSKHSVCPPVIVGSGPAGLFAALRLAQAGYNPIVVERGSEVAERQHKVDEFLKTGILGMQSNFQFGEGGAGIFSDGKLTTNTKSAYNRTVLETFVCAGAPDEILWQAKPHIGTDRLVEVVKALRMRIQELGGTVLFDTRLTGVAVEQGRITGAHIKCSIPLKAQQFLKIRPRLDQITMVESGAEPLEVTIACDTLIFAGGHSTRDTYEVLYEQGLHMEAKPFSLGVRIEHEQAAIDRAQYGTFAGHPALGPAEYKLVEHLKNGRNVYTFCMCPGGIVVPAASEIEGVVTNGMSTFARDGHNANAALLVDVRPSDFGSDHPLAGMEFQRRWEQAAYELGGGSYQAPAQYVGDFLAGRSSEQTEIDPANAVSPSYPRGVTWSDVRRCLPAFVADALSEALPCLDRRLRGFAAPGAVMTGVETRSSSPVTIVRDASMQANIKGFYPCGEGAGYAGGIMSAAVDGLRVAEAILS